MLIRLASVTILAGIAVLMGGDLSIGQTPSARTAEQDYLQDLQTYLTRLNHPYAQISQRNDDLAFGYWLCDRYEEGTSFEVIARSVMQSTSLSQIERERIPGYLLAVHVAAVDNICPVNPN